MTCVFTRRRSHNNNNVISTTQYTLFSRVGRRRFARVSHITILFRIRRRRNNNILVWPYYYYYYYGIITATILHFASRTSLHAHLHALRVRILYQYGRRRLVDGQLLHTNLRLAELPRAYVVHENPRASVAGSRRTARGRVTNGVLRKSRVRRHTRTRRRVVGVLKRCESF